MCKYTSWMYLYVYLFFLKCVYYLKTCEDDFKFTYQIQDSLLKTLGICYTYSRASYLIYVYFEFIKVFINIFSWISLLIHNKECIFRYIFMMFS